MNRFLNTVLFIAFFNPVFGQIAAGPMVCYSEMREVLLWIQTEKANKVQIEYWEKGDEKNSHKTNLVKTTAENDFTAKLLANEILPSKTYEYRVILNKKAQKISYPLQFQSQTLWQFRTDPPSFKFVAGSCIYTNEERFDRPGAPYGKSYGIFEKIYNQKPNFMIWGGDNIYLREVDYNTKTGINHRYKEFKKKKELQPLFGSIHNYAIWDDHDYGNNDADRGFYGKNITLEAFKNQWGNLNYVFKDEAVTGTFMWEDCQFFLLDDRWFRAPNRLEDDNKDYFGEKQLTWLIDALENSNAPFKFIVSGGQIINESKVFENMSNYSGERQKLLDLIEKNKIPGVLFISGDRHHTVIHKLDRTDYPLYDITVSPITSGTAKPMAEELKNKTIVPNTLVSDIQNFGVFEVSGPRLDRVLKINIFDANGEKKWDYEIKAKDLKTNKKD